MKIATNSTYLTQASYYLININLAILIQLKMIL